MVVSQKPSPRGFHFYKNSTLSSREYFPRADWKCQSRGPDLSDRCSGRHFISVKKLIELAEHLRHMCFLEIKSLIAGHLLKTFLILWTGHG